jgi:transposase
MKKISTARMKRQAAKAKKWTIGIDLGDQSSRYCVLDEQGDVIVEGSVATTKTGMEKLFGAMPRCRIAMETGCHSPWVSRQLHGFGHEVIVANPRNVGLIGESTRKDDRLDARTLARLARIDPNLLSPVRHRGAEAQTHLAVIRARHVLVRMRTTLVNAARGLTKSFGERLRKCDPRQLGVKATMELSSEIQAAVAPLLAEVETLNQRISAYDRQIEQLAKEHYPEVDLLKQVNGVGTLIALTFVLTVDDPHRFRRSRDVGCYLGLRPGRRNSGKSQPQMHISKEGDSYVRTLLVQGAHYILGPFGRDCDLRRWGLKLAERGGKNAKEASDYGGGA